MRFLLGRKVQSFDGTIVTLDNGSTLNADFVVLGVGVKPRLELASEGQETLARSVLDKAKRACLVTNSLTAACELVPSVSFAQAGPAD